MHSDLIAKLEALDGPDREVDLELTTKFFGGREADLHRAYGLHCYDFTSSLDAAVALVERVLLEHAREISVWPGSCHVTILMTDENGFHNSSMGSFEALHEIEAIALLIATLKALEARDG